MSLRRSRGRGTQSEFELPLRVATLDRHETTCDTVAGLVGLEQDSHSCMPSLHSGDGDVTGASAATEAVHEWPIRDTSHCTPSPPSPPCRSASCRSANSRASSSRPAPHPRTSDAAPASRDPLPTPHTTQSAVSFTGRARGMNNNLSCQRAVLCAHHGFSQQASRVLAPCAWPPALSLASACCTRMAVRSPIGFRISGSELYGVDSHGSSGAGEVFSPGFESSDGCSWCVSQSAPWAAYHPAHWCAQHRVHSAHRAAPRGLLRCPTIRTSTGVASSSLELQLGL